MVKRLIVLTFLISLSACGRENKEENKEEKAEKVFWGSLWEAEKCFKLANAKMISKDLVRYVCAQKHATDLVDLSLDGKAGYSETYPSGYVFKGSVKNQTGSSIATSFELVVKHPGYKDSSGTVIEQVYSYGDMWIEPNESQNFVVSKDGLEFQPKSSEIGADKFEWYIQNIKGMSLWTH